MARVIVARLAQSVVLLLLVSVATFALVRLAPGDPGTLLYGPSASAAELSQLRERWGLDEPLHLQYFRWLSNAVSGDLGRSYTDGRPVLAVIEDRIPATLALAVAALTLASVVGIYVGFVTANPASPWVDRPLRVLTVVLYSIPPFWLGIVLILVFSVSLRWLPPGGLQNSARDAGIGDLLAHLALPVLALSVREAARFARVTRASVIAVETQDFVRTAAAKGLGRGLIERRHILRNAMLPVTALYGLAIPGLLSGTVVVETVFSWPGMGRLAIESALQRNYPVIMGEVLIVASLAIAGSLLADIACTAADPRIRDPFRR